MKKRGQITIFIILGLVIFIIIFFLWYLSSQTQTFSELQEKLESTSLSEEARTAVDSFEDCLIKITQEAVVYTSARGGYYNPPANSFIFGSGFVPIYYDQGEDNFPSITEIDENIAKYIENNLDRCIIYASSSKTQIKIQKDPQTEVDTNKETTSVYLKMPVTISSNSGQSRASIFRININSILKQAYENAEKIYSEQKKSGSDTLLGSLNLLSSEKEFILDMRISNGTIFFFTTYNKTKIANTELKFNFAIRKEINSNDSSGLQLINLFDQGGLTLFTDEELYNLIPEQDQPSETFSLSDEQAEQIDEEFISDENLIDSLEQYEEYLTEEEQ